MEASERLSRAPAPQPATQNVEDVLAELGVSGRPKSVQRKKVAEEGWRLTAQEIGWLHEAGLTTLTREMAELMGEGYSERAAREVVAVRRGEIGPGTTRD